MGNLYGKQGWQVEMKHAFDCEPYAKNVWFDFINQRQQN